MALLDSINTLNSWANECRLILYNLEDDLDWRTISAYNLGAHGGVGWVAYYNRAVIADLIEAMQYFVYGAFSPFNYTTWFSVHWGLYMQEADVPPLTWQTICEAWTKNDFEGKEWTIAIIDHMRKLMWDEPFSVQWAAKPAATRE